MDKPGAPVSNTAISAVRSNLSRPQRAGAQRNRDRVLEAARDVFGAEGSFASLDEIARRAGVGIGTVYRHFAGKEVLLEAVVFEHVAELVEDAHALSDHPNPGRALSCFIELLGREVALNRDLVEALTVDGVRHQLRAAPNVRDLIDVLAELMCRAQRAGAVRRDIEVDDVAALLTGIALAFCQTNAEEERMSRILSIMCDGLRAGCTTSSNGLIKEIM